MSNYRIDILVCGGTGCHASGSIETIKTFKSEIEKAGYQNEVQVIATGCFGFCEKGPIVKIMPDNIFYVDINEAKAKHIEGSHESRGQEQPENKGMTGFPRGQKNFIL